MTPQLLVAAGAIGVLAGYGLLLSFGRRFRLGRLLASTPAIAIGEAVVIARSGERRYVRIQGRIESEHEFEDVDHRPLVLRRTRFAARSGPAVLGRWRTFESNVEIVPFAVREGVDDIDIDVASLGEGLVVIERESRGVLADLGERAPGALPSNDPARVAIEQVSSVEHAIVLGVPGLGSDDRPRLSAGLGRPLVLTTLEIPEAMRMLTGGAVLRSRVAAALLVGGAGLAGLGLVWWLTTFLVAPVTAFAASAAPSILPGADTRSAGQGPGLVGDSLLAILGVFGIGVLTIGATLVYVRLTAARGARSSRQPNPSRSRRRQP